MQRKKEIVSSAHAMVNRSLNSVVVLVRIIVGVRSDAVVVDVPIDYQPPPSRRRRHHRRTLLLHR